MPNTITQINETLTENIIEWLDPDNNRNGDYLYPIDRDKIKVMVNSIPISTLMDYIKRWKIELQPYFQRSYVWNEEKAAWLIDSIWKGLPIPQIFLLQKEDWKSLVIDWQQRLTSIARFFLGQKDLEESLSVRPFIDSRGDNNIKLKVDKNIFYPNIPQWTEDIDFSQLEGIEQDKFESESLTVAIISPIYPLFEWKERKEELKRLSREIFNRLNTWWMPLTPQEIRQSLYSWKFMAALKEISFGIEWSNILPVWLKKFQDEPSFKTELLIRAMAFLESYGDLISTDTLKLSNFSYFKPLNDFLDKYTEISYDFNDAQIEERINLLNKTIKQLSLVTDDGFLRHQTTSSSNRKANFNIKYIDTLFVWILNFLRTNTLTDNELKSKIDTFKNNAEFIDSHIMIQWGWDVAYTENRVTSGINLIKS